MFVDNHSGNAPARGCGFYSWPRPYSRSPAYPVKESMRVHDSIKRLAVFIGIEVTGGIHWGGTGFFVDIPSDINADYGYRYFVTASHVAEAVAGRKFFLRINKAGGGSHLFDFPATHQWFRHPTEDVDVALFPFDPDHSIFDYRSLPIGQFLNDELSGMRSTCRKTSSIEILRSEPQKCAVVGSRS